MDVDKVWTEFNELASDITKKILGTKEQSVFKGIWKGLTYSEIALEANCSTATVNRIAASLFEITPKILGIDREVSKSNFKTTIEQYLEESLASCQSNAETDREVVSSPLYVEPKQLQDCYNKIVKPGALIRIKGPKKMGKTLLMNKILESASQKGYETVKLNILQPEQAVVENLKSFLLWLCDNVARRLQISEQVTDIWKDFRGANDNCTIYFEECILEKIDKPLVLGLDNVDRVFQYPDVAADFFGLLRSWFEDAKVIDIWKNIRLVVAYSTEVYIPLNVNNSPFNVGEFVELPEFNSEEVGLLARGYDLNLEPDKIDKLMALVGGHPYLVKTALYNLKKEPNVALDELLLAASTNAGIYRGYLTEISQYLQDNPELAIALKKVIEAEEAVRLTDEEAFKLDSLGLVRKYGNDVTWRWDLYRQFFADRLI